MGQGGIILTVFARILTALSAILLLVTAYYHSTGLESVVQAVESVSLPPFLSQAIPGLWVFFSWHLTVLAVPLLWAATQVPSWFLPATVFCGVVVLGDFVLIYRIAGWFPGTGLLLFTAICLLTVSIMLKRDANATSN